MTFKEIETEALNAPWGSDKTANEVFHLVGEARENAISTVYAEKTLPAEKEEEIAMSSLEGLLSCYQGPKEVCEWFAARGVRW